MSSPSHQVPTRAARQDPDAPLRVDLRIPFAACAVEGFLLLGLYTLLTYLKLPRLTLLGLVFLGVYALSVGVTFTAFAWRLSRSRRNIRTAELLTADIYRMFRSVMDIPYAVINGDNRVRVINAAMQSILGARSPVCDLPRSETDFIYDRAFSTDPQQTSLAVGAAVESYGQSGLICALKHFPGYGNNLDTHTGISIDERPLSEITELDLEPFRAGISAGAPVVMVSHNIVNCIDDSLPGSLSGKMYAFLREQGFTGAAMTDDLSMDAVGEYSGENAAAVTALKAGADLLCCTDYASAAEALTAAVESGEIPEERIDEAVTRVLLMKLTYGIIE